MRHRTIRAILAIWIAIPAIVGLYRPVAASMPITLDVSDGYTFSGETRTSKYDAAGNPIDVIENPIGPFTISGNRGFFQSSWNVGQVDSYLNCDPEQFIRSVSETIQNRQKNHYSVDLSGTTAKIESAYLGIPTFENSGPGTTTAFPVDDLVFRYEYFDHLGQQVSRAMTQVPPQAGDSIGYVISFSPALDAGDFFSFDILFQGEVEPPLSGNPQMSSLDCPPPNDDLEETSDFGLTQLFLRDPYVVLNVAEDVQNLPPVFELVGPTTVAEGGTINPVLTITDPEGAGISTFDFLPSDPAHPCSPAIDISVPGVVTIAFNCAPEAGDEGKYIFDITAGDGVNTVTSQVVISVSAGNIAPVLNLINDVTIDEGGAATISISGSDDDGDDLTITGNLPDFANLTDNGDGTGTITVSPDFDDGGIHLASVDISDNGDPSLGDTQTFTISVNNVNRNPNIAPINDVVVNEGDTADATINVSEPDDDDVIITGDVPPFCVVNDSGDGTGALQCSPGHDDSGLYSGTITATDNGDPALVDSSTVTIIVDNSNRAPTVSPIADLTMEEGEERGRGVSAGDADGDSLTITLVSGPSFANLTDNGDGTADILFTPGVNDAGTYTVTVWVTDNSDPSLSTEATFTVVVNDVNRPPLIDPVGNQEVVQGQDVFGTITASDPEGDPITFSMAGPSFCNLTDNGDGTASFACDTTTAPSGVHTVTVTAFDGAEQSSITFDIRILPDVDAQGPYTVVLGESTQVTATGPANGTFEWDLDDDGDFETTGQSATFNSAGFSIGAHTVTVRVTSFDGTTSNTDTATVIVLAGPNSPVLDPIPDRSMPEGSVFPVDQDARATDADGDPITLTATITPPEFEAYFSFTDNGDGTGTAHISNAIFAGEYTITVTASDGSQTDTETFTLTVEPSVDPGGPYYVSVGGLVEITPSSPSATEFSYDLDGDGVIDATGPSFTFDATGLALGNYAVTIIGCLPGGQICTSVEALVIVEGLNLVTYDQLESLTRDAVDRFIVERVLLTALSLAEFFDERGAERAARALLETFIRLVERFTGTFIASDDAALMIDYAQALLQQLPE